MIRLNKGRKLILAVTGAVALMGVGACSDNKAVWSGTYSFPNSRWQQDSFVEFAPDSAVIGKCEAGTAELSIRYGEDASVERLPLVMEMENPNEGSYGSDTVSIALIAREHRTSGTASFGIFESCDTIRLPFTITPGCKISFHPVNSTEVIKGIYSLTVQLIK